MSYAADLIQVYQQALRGDPGFQAIIAERFATQEGLPISIASLLPNIDGFDRWQMT